MLPKGRRAIQYGVTISILLAAMLAAVLIWDRYLTGAWTRDGQIQADVAKIAPDVAGRVIKLHVSDNQAVQKGDPLFEIDPVDFQIALAMADANVESKRADLTLRQQQAKRRAGLTTLSTSEEELQTYNSNADVARAAYATALAQQSQARVDLERTRILSPVNGYVTNLLLREGDYVAKGAGSLAVLDSDSFRAVGYVEENKISGIHVGDRAVVALAAYRTAITGQVESIARGINTPNTAPGALGLASVNPVFTWVRLSQRIPIRIRLDPVPPTVTLALGLTATITFGPAADPASLHGILSRAATQTGR